MYENEKQSTTLSEQFQSQISKS